MTAERERALREGVEELIRARVGSVIPADLSFFEAGLTSATLVAVHAELLRHVGEEFPISILFKYPTTRALVAFLSRKIVEPSVGRIDHASEAGAWTPRARREFRARLRERKG